MKLAETARSHWVIALASVAVGATAIIAASRTCAKQPAPEKLGTPVKAWRGCHQRVAAPAPRPALDGATYRDVLLAARPAFEACTRGQPRGVFYEIRLPIGPDGHVMSVEVRGRSSEISRVSMKVVKCLEQAVSPLHFPATGERTFVTTGILTDR